MFFTLKISDLESSLCKKHSDIINKMRIKMKKTTLATALLLSTAAFTAQSEEVTSVAAPASGSATYRAFNTPVNYNFGEFMIGQGKNDGDDVEVLVIRGGGEGMITENWIYNLYYDGGIIDEDSYTYKSNEISLGAMYRFPVVDNLDFVFGGDFVYMWDEFDSFYNNEKNNEIGYALKSSLRYGFTQNFEGKLGFDYVKLGDFDAKKEANASVTFYPAPNFGIGASYAATLNDKTFTTIGGHVRFNF